MNERAPFQGALLQMLVHSKPKRKRPSPFIHSKESYVLHSRVSLADALAFRRCKLLHFGRVSPCRLGGRPGYVCAGNHAGAESLIYPLEVVSVPYNK